MDPAPLAGQVAIITGASSGIGRAIAVALSEAGASVVLGARRTAELEAVGERLAGRYVVVRCDVTVSDDVAALVARAHEDFGQVDGLVNNAGMGCFAPITEMDPSDWRQMLEVNATGSFLCARAVLPSMFERGDGWIVNVCSDVSKRVFAGGGAYCASKYAQYALSLTLGKECRPRGVRVGAVLPGIVGTEFAGGKPREHSSWVLQPEDVADAVVFMATRPPHLVVDELTVHPVQQEF